MEWFDLSSHRAKLDRECDARGPFFRLSFDMPTPCIDREKEAVVTAAGWEKIRHNTFVNRNSVHKYSDIAKLLQVFFVEADIDIKPVDQLKQGERIFDERSTGFIVAPKIGSRKWLHPDEAAEKLHLISDLFKSINSEFGKWWAMLPEDIQAKADALDPKGEFDPLAWSEKFSRLGDDILTNLEKADEEQIVAPSPSP